MSDADDKSVPFARRPVQWGRPPQTTFRAGPLPRGTGLVPPAPAPAQAPAAPRPASGGVLGGSLVPQRRPAQPGTGPTLLTTPMPTAPQPARPAAPVAPAAPVDATPRPLPTAALARAPEPASRPSVASAPKPAPGPAVAAPEVEPSRADAPVASRAFARNGGNRTPLYIAAAAVVVISAPVATWLITRSNSDTAPAAPATSAVLAAPTPAASAVEAAPAPVDTPVAAPQTPAAPRAVTRSPAPRRAEAASSETLAANPRPAPVVASPATVAPAPVVVIAPPVEAASEPVQPAGPPPTAARPAQSDPNAPVVTKPQPLD